MDKISQLEQVFARNPQSPVFTLLASCYYKKRLYKNAVQVCQVGLKNDPHNIPGQYILVKLLLIKGELLLAEKFLKNIIYEQPHQLNALLLLISVMQKLKRSKKNIISYISIGAEFYPSHNLVQQYYTKYCIVRPIKRTKRGQHISLPAKSNFLFNPKLATKTLYNLFYAQSKYKEAYTVLSIMQENSKNKKFVSTEMQKIKNIYKRS